MYKYLQRTTDSSVQGFSVEVALAGSLGLLSIMPIVQVFGLTAYTAVSLLFIAWLTITNQLRLNFRQPFTIYLVFASMSAFISVLADNCPTPYLINNVSGILNLVVVYLLICSFESLDRTLRKAFWKGFMLGCKVQAVWIIVQGLLFQLSFLDLNGMVFGQSADVGLFRPTGLCWNSGGIATTLVIGFLFCPSLSWKMIFVLAAFSTQSMTIVLGISSAVVLAGISRLRSRSSRYIAKKRYKIHYGVIAITIILILIVVFPHLFVSRYRSIVSYIGYRTSFISNLAAADSSSHAHISYLTNIPKLLNRMDPIKALFGYGVNCSGYPYSALTGQYNSKVWIVECDYVNILLNTGLLGFASYYFWYVRSMLSSITYKNSSLLIAYISIGLMGLTYNVQAPYVILVLALMQMLIKEAWELNPSRGHLCGGHSQIQVDGVGGDNSRC